MGIRLVDDSDQEEFSRRRKHAVFVIFMKRNITEQIIRCILDKLENNLSRKTDA